ncbi:MAG: 50S ribosomal protein L15 [Planctomycetota bacterium]|nr:MAG: 50S ribosomal protein L15 [Planctomycetota bacterium]
MNLFELNKGSGKYKNRKRIGRGHAAGGGKTAGRGHNGAHSRSGWSKKRGFEGGQTPLFQRLPKRGFSNVRFRVSYDIINVGDLNQVPEDIAMVNLEYLAENGLVRKRHSRLKILGSGKLDRKMVVEAARFSKTAREQIEGLGGEAKTV